MCLLQGGKDSQDALKLRVILSKRATKNKALLRKISLKMKHSVGPCHPVLLITEGKLIRNDVKLPSVISEGKLPY